MERPRADFFLELPVRSDLVGRPVVVGLRDLTLAELCEGIPDGVPEPAAMTEDRWQCWLDRLLARAIVTPEFLRDPARVRRLGPDRDNLIEAVLARWRMGLPSSFVLRLRRMARALGIRPTDAQIVKRAATSR